MGLLQCPRCQKDISAKDKHCPWCKTKISLFNDLRFQLERSRIKLIVLVLGALLALGVAWFWRMDGGGKWPLYAVLVLVAPLVPWVLKTAYAIASPPDTEQADSTEPAPVQPEAPVKILESPADFLQKR